MVKTIGEGPIIYGGPSPVKAYPGRVDGLLCGEGFGFEIRPSPADYDEISGATRIDAAAVYGR